MILTLIAFLFTISILVFVHELGHFVVAKKSGIKVEEFGFGIPPRVWGKKIGETIYSINLLPIGGFVKMFGEDGEQVERVEQVAQVDKKRAFWAKPKKVRASVVAAGALMNVFLAIFVFWVIYMGLGIPTKTDKVMIVGLVENAPADQAGLVVDDVVVAVEGEEIKSVDQFIKIVEENKGSEIEIVVDRPTSAKDTSSREHLEGEALQSGAVRRIGGPHLPGEGIDEVEELVSVMVTPRQSPPEGEGSLGVVISQVELKFFPLWQRPFLALQESLKETFGWAAAVSGGIAQMIWQLIKFGRVPKDIAGPIGIFQVTGMVARQGVFSVLQFIGILSINLAVINILPFPPLDGGKLLFIGAEGIFGRKTTPKIEKWAQTFGIILLLLLFIWISINDVSRILSPTRFF